MKLDLVFQHSISLNDAITQFQCIIERVHENKRIGSIPIDNSSMDITKIDLHAVFIAMLCIQTEYTVQAHLLDCLVAEVSYINLSDILLMNDILNGHQLGRLGYIRSIQRQILLDPFNEIFIRENLIRDIIVFMRRLELIPINSLDIRLSDQFESKLLGQFTRLLILSICSPDKLIDLRVLLGELLQHLFHHLRG